ncbi:hypothetical protein GCM10027596_41140 [Nocardioides korecus]
MLTRLHGVGGGELSLHRGAAWNVVSRYQAVPAGMPQLRTLAEEAAALAQTPVAAINLITATVQRTLASVGTEVTILARRDSMCGAIVDGCRPVHVMDASMDERWATNPFVDGRWGNVRFYGGHPLVSREGFPVGTLCVLDERPRRLDAWRTVALENLARRVVHQLDLYEPSLGSVARSGDHHVWR